MDYTGNVVVGRNGILKKGAGNNQKSQFSSAPPHSWKFCVRFFRDVHVFKTLKATLNDFLHFLYVSMWELQICHIFHCSFQSDIYMFCFERIYFSNYKVCSQIKLYHYIIRLTAWYLTFASYLEMTCFI